MLKLLLGAITASVLYSAITEAANDPGDADKLGFSPKAWGPGVWSFMHICALNLPPEFGTSSREFEHFIFTLQKVLPCKECRDEFQHVLQVISPRSFLKHGRIGAIAFTYVIHCIISSRVKAAECTVKFLETEPKLLKQYMKDNFDVDTEMKHLYKMAEETQIQLKIDAALIKWRLHISKH